MTVRSSVCRRTLIAGVSCMVVLAGVLGCGAERSTRGVVPTLPAADPRVPPLPVVPSVPARDILSYPWGTVRLVSIRTGLPPAKLAGAPDGARLLAPAEVELELTGEHAGSRNLALSGWTKDEIGEMRVAVKDGNGSELWAMGWGADRPGRHLVYESAPGVELKMVQDPQADGQVAESYRLRLGPLVKECRIAYDPHSPSGREQALAEFGRFYIAGTPLDDNFEGHLAESLIMNRNFVLWTANQIRHPRVLYKDIAEIGGEKNWLTAICAAAAACSFLKCGFAGLLNPMCDICGGIALVCALIGLFGWD